MVDKEQLQMMSMFMDLASMNNAAQHLFDISQKELDKANYILPSAVLKAFSAELGIKSILTMNGVKQNHTHNLESLFFQLDSESKTEIQRSTIDFYNERNSNKIDFDSELHNIAGSFESFRYFYENINLNTTNLGNFMFLACFCFAVIVQFTKVEKEFVKDK